MALKGLAWLLTGSVGLLSDAAESMVNLFAALVAVGALVGGETRGRGAPLRSRQGRISLGGLRGGADRGRGGRDWCHRDRRPPASSAADGRGLGLIVSAAASPINLGVGTMLVRNGRRERSITLEADGRHLDRVWTSAGVIVGVGAVAIPGWERLDGIIALVVAVNIVFTGARLLRQSASGVMDRALDDAAQGKIEQVLSTFEPAALTSMPCERDGRDSGHSSRLTSSFQGPERSARSRSR